MTIKNIYSEKEIKVSQEKGYLLLSREVTGFCSDRFNVEDGAFEVYYNKEFNKFFALLEKDGKVRVNEFIFFN